MYGEQPHCQCGKLATIEVYQNHILYTWDEEVEEFEEIDDEFGQDLSHFCQNCFEKEWPGYFDDEDEDEDEDYDDYNEEDFDESIDDTE